MSSFHDMERSEPITFLPHTSKGWKRVWEAIKAKYGDEECLHNFEVWQYMGSIPTEHQFRHRSLNGKRVYEKIDVQADDYQPL